MCVIDATGATYNVNNVWENVNEKNFDIKDTVSFVETQTTFHDRDDD